MARQETLEFFITRRRDGYHLCNEAGDSITGFGFRTDTDAADMAVRFAQDLDALYRIHY